MIDRAEDEMVQGYRDGLDLDAPEPSEPTNGWQPMDSCPRLDYESYLVVARHWDGTLVREIAMFDPECGDFHIFKSSAEPIYWQHLPCLPGETLLPDEERQRLFDEQMEEMLRLDESNPALR